jgi:hypothetical protein
MLSRFALALSLLVASAGSLSAMSDCQAECEAVYKACAAKKVKSESACRVEYEKCRKACAKKAGKPSPN